MTRITSLVVAITLVVMLALAGNSIWRGTGLDSGWGLLIGSILGAVMGGKEIADRLSSKAATAAEAKHAVTAETGSAAPPAPAPHGGANHDPPA